MSWGQSDCVIYSICSDAEGVWIGHEEKAEQTRKMSVCQLIYCIFQDSPKVISYGQ